MKRLSKIWNLIFGKTEYILTVLSVNGEVVKYTFSSLADVDICVSECNESIYGQVQKIEKIRRLEFTYDKMVLQQPLWFSGVDVTTTDYIGKQKYSFILPDKSLNNIKHVESKKL